MPENCQTEPTEVDAAGGPPPDGRPEKHMIQVRTFDELRSSGILWLINRVVFHPRGFAVALVLDKDKAVGWGLFSTANPPFVYSNEDDDALFRAAEKTLAEALEKPDAVIARSSDA